MSRSHRPIDDPEILSLFKDEPELLAIVDALAATRPRRRRRGTRRLGVIAAAALLAVLLLALVPRQLGGDGLAERALAAVGSGRVVHLVVSRPETDRSVVDLASGNEQATTVELESWFDSETGDLRTATRRDGELVADTFLHREVPGPGSPSSGSPDPVVTVFLRGYRAALERGDVELLRRGRLDDHEVVWARLGVRSGSKDEVALDATTDLPRAFRFVVGSGPPGPIWRVLALDSRSRSEDDFTVVTIPMGPTRGEIDRELIVSPDAATAALEGRARWVGPEIDRLPLTRVSVQRLSRTFADGRRQTGTGVEFLYGGRPGDFVRIQQSVMPEPAYGFLEARFVLGFAPIPPEGAVALAYPSQGNRGFWRGQQRSGGIYVTILASERQLVLDAARALAPLP